MDCVGLASLRHQRNDNAAPDGSGADLCPALCPIHIGRHCRGGRPRRARSQGTDARRHREPKSRRRIQHRSAERRSRPFRPTRSPGRRGGKIARIPPNQSSAPRHRPHCATSFWRNSRQLASSDEATTWAHRILGAKNSLTAADARQVEDAFQARLATFGTAADIGDMPLSPVLSRRSRLRQRAAVRGTDRNSHCRRHRQEPVGPSRAAPLS